MYNANNSATCRWAGNSLKYDGKIINNLKTTQRKKWATNNNPAEWVSSTRFFEEFEDNVKSEDILMYEIFHEPDFNHVD